MLALYREITVARVSYTGCQAAARCQSWFWLLQGEVIILVTCLECNSMGWLFLGGHDWIMWMNMFTGEEHKMHITAVMFPEHLSS